MTTPPTDQPKPTLARGVLGLPEIAFQGMTHMGPAVAITSAIPFAFLFAGGSAPLAVLFAFVACFLAAVSMGQLAKHIPSAGGMYTYAARGLHPAVGFLVAWAFGLVEAAVSPLLYLLLSLTLADQLHVDFGWSPHLWWIWTLAIGAVVFSLGYFRIQLPARTGIVLGAIEIAVFVVLCLWLIIKAGGANSFSVFGTGYANASGFKGLSGVVAAAVFTVLAYIGFEEAIPLSEEVRQPRRNVGRALMTALIGVGLLFLLAAYAASVYFGPARGTGFASFNNGNPWVQIARNVWGVGWVVVFLVIIDSYVANSNAASMALTRTWFAMGRIRILPGALASVHPRTRAPHVALAAQVIFGVAVTLILGGAYGALTGALVVGTFVTEVFVPIYMIVNLACLVYYLRRRRSQFNWLLHGLIPVAGIVVLVPVFLAGAGIPSFSFVTKLAAPLSYSGPFAAAWMLIGAGYLVYLYRRHPDRVAATATIFLPDEASAASEQSYA
jgi:amino acid transporter